MPPLTYQFYLGLQSGGQQVHVLFGVDQLDDAARDAAAGVARGPHEVVRIGVDDERAAGDALCGQAACCALTQVWEREIPARTGIS